ncbi:hypothetical protein MIC448_170001 [Microbacterium sp. C448]|nr:hypothetical protein MIC448_170001 [Microbacterium sp. C448]
MRSRTLSHRNGPPVPVRDRQRAMPESTPRATPPDSDPRT